MNKFLYEHTFPFVLDEYPRVEWLGHSILSPGMPIHLDEVVTSFVLHNGCDCLLASKDLHQLLRQSFWTAWLRV